ARGARRERGRTNPQICGTCLFLPAGCGPRGRPFRPHVARGTAPAPCEPGDRISSFSRKGKGPAMWNGRDGAGSLAPGRGDPSTRHGTPGGAGGGCTLQPYRSQGPAVTISLAVTEPKQYQ